MKIKPPTDKELRYYKKWPHHSKNKYLFWLKYGSLGWGLPTGTVVSLIEYFSNRSEFSIYESIFKISFFTVFGLFFGMFLYKGNAKRYQEIQEFLKLDDKGLT